MDNCCLTSYPVEVMNLHFPNLVGLAAGFDRDGKLINSLNSAGFGFIEVGTINVNSELESNTELKNIVRNLEHAKDQSTNQALIGISLGSSRDEIDDHTVADYLQGMEIFWHHADYIVINLSRPGSSMRSEAKNYAELRCLLEKIKQRHTLLCKKHNNYVPIITKVAIEYENKNISLESLTIANQLEFDGLLIAYEHWPSTADVVASVSEMSVLTSQRPLIIVGGIKSADNALKILKAGASLVQCYSFFADQGSSGMINMINKLSLLAKGL